MVTDDDDGDDNDFMIIFHIEFINLGAKIFKVDEFCFFASDSGGCGRGAVDDNIELIFTTTVEWYTICSANIQ